MCACVYEWVLHWVYSSTSLKSLLTDDSMDRTRKYDAKWNKPGGWKTNTIWSHL